MSGSKLKLCVALAALALPASATGQCPRGVCNVVVGDNVDIPLRDGTGNVRAILRYYGGEPTKRVILFIDAADGKVINSITETPTAATGANPLSGAPVPDVLGPDQEKADGPDDIQFLKQQIKALREQVRLLAERINAAAAK